MKLALVTGASSGIGKECARLLATKRYNLIIVARRKEILDEIAVELRGKFNIEVHCIKMDLANLSHKPTFSGFAGRVC